MRCQALLDCHTRQLGLEYAHQEASPRAAGPKSLLPSTSTSRHNVTWLFVLMLTFSSLLLCGVSQAVTVQADMRLYSDSGFANELSGDLTVATDKRLYVQVSADLYASSVVKVVLSHCWATPTTSASDPTVHNLINNPGCSADSQSIEVMTNGQGSYARFNYQVFKFASSPTVTLFCSLKLCVETCAPACSSRKRRSEDDSPADVLPESATVSRTVTVQSVVAQPHQLLPGVDEKAHNVTSDDTGSPALPRDDASELSEHLRDNLLIAVGALAGVTLLCIISTFLLIRHRRMKLLKKQEAMKRNVDVNTIIPIDEKVGRE